MLTLTGNASLADYQDALSHILFSNTERQPEYDGSHADRYGERRLGQQQRRHETIHVTAINDAPTATADHVITNFGNNKHSKFRNSALIANDTDPDICSAQHQRRGGATSGSATHAAGAHVTFTDTAADNNSPNGGSFDYTASDGGTLHVIRPCDSRPSSGTTLNGSARKRHPHCQGWRAHNERQRWQRTFLSATPASHIMNGGTGNDTFVFKAIADSHPGAGNFDTITGFHARAPIISILRRFAGTTIVQGEHGSTDPSTRNSISWFNDGIPDHRLRQHERQRAGHVDMEIHLTGSNINLTGSDILHHT